MKKVMVAICLSLLLTASVIMAEPTGVGVYAGSILPIVQADQGTGYTLGLKARIRLNDLFVLEPNLNFGSYGEAEEDGVGTREGSSITHYGVDLVLGNKLATLGFKPYAFIGGALYNTKRDGDETTNKSGWSLGLGFAMGLSPKMDLDVRGRANIAASEGSSTRKSVGVTGGITYYFGTE
ncbi:MAG: porin family protein [FCB group bacterium]|nr:porin family protein [FCB group bacterium]